MVRACRQALSRHGLDVLRGRGPRQGAARRGDPQRDRRRARSRARAISPPARRSRSPAALGDETLPHLPFPEFSFGVVVSGPEEMREAVRMFLKYGVDTMKLNLSGEYIAGIPAEFTPMTDDEMAVAVEEAQAARQARAGARALQRIGQAVRAPRHRA